MLDELRNQVGSTSRPGGAKGDEFTVAESLGLDRATQIVGRWGFRGKALLTDVRFLNPGPMTGVAGLLDRAGLPRDHLPPIPRAMGTFAVGSFHRGDVRRRDRALARHAEARVCRPSRGGREGAARRHRSPSRRGVAPPPRADLVHLRVAGGPGGTVGSDRSDGPGRGRRCSTRSARSSTGRPIASTITSAKWRVARGTGGRPAATRPPWPSSGCRRPARGYRLVSPAGVGALADRRPAADGPRRQVVRRDRRQPRAGAEGDRRGGPARHMLESRPASW